MANATNRGSFLPTTTIFDTSFIQSVDVNGQDFKEFLVNLRRTVSDIVTTLNEKTTGQHILEEFVTGSLYFANPAYNSTTALPPVQRAEFLLTVNFGTLPNTATKSVAHGITFPTGNTLTAVHIRGAATDPIAQIQIPLPYASPVLANNISLDFDATNVNVTTGSDRTAFTDCKIILKYLKE